MFKTMTLLKPTVLAGVILCTVLALPLSTSTCNAATTNIETVVQSGHLAGITAVALSRDGNLLASAESDYVVIWHVPTRRQYRIVRPKDRFIHRIQFVGDNGLLIEYASGSDVCDITTGKILHSYVKRGVPMTKEANRRDTAADEVVDLSLAQTGGWAALAEVRKGEMNIQAAQNQKRWTVPALNQHTTLLLSPNGRYLATAYASAFAIFDMETGAKVMTHLFPDSYSLMGLEKNIFFDAMEQRFAVAAVAINSSDTITNQCVWVFDIPAARGSTQTNVAPVLNVTLPTGTLDQNFFAFAAETNAVLIMTPTNLWRFSRDNTNGEVIFDTRGEFTFSAIGATRQNLLPVGIFDGNVAAALFDCATSNIVAKASSPLVRFSGAAFDEQTGELYGLSRHGFWKIDTARAEASRLCESASPLIKLKNGIARAHIGRGRVEKVDMRLESHPIAFADYGTNGLEYVPVAYNAAGSMAAVATESGIGICETESSPWRTDGTPSRVAERRHVQVPLRDQIKLLAFDASGNYLFACDKAVATVIDVGTGKVVATNDISKFWSRRIIRPPSVCAWPEHAQTWLLANDESGLSTFSSKDGLRTAWKGRIERFCVSGSGKFGLVEGSKSARILDLEQMREIAEAGDCVGGAFSPDQSLVVGAHRDGTLGFWNVTDGALKSSLAINGIADYAFFTPEGFYKSTRGGLHTVAFRLGRNVYGLQEFDQEFNRPDIVLGRFKASPELITNYEKLRQARLQRLGSNAVENVSQDKPILTVGRLPLEIDATNITVVVAARSRAAMSRMLVSINQVPVGGRAGFQIGDGSATNVTARQQIPLVEGHNEIEIVVVDASGARSLPVMQQVRCTAHLEKPRVYFVGFGVSEYANGNLNLRYAAKDTCDIAAYLRSWENVQTRTLVLTNEQVSQSAIDKAREFLAAAKPNDLMIVHIAGHGIQAEHGDYYFGTHSLDLKNPAATGIAFSKFEDLLDSASALRRILLIDTCQAGEAVAAPKAVEVAMVASPRGPERVSTRGVVINAGNLQGRSELAAQLEQAFVDLRQSTGAMIIGACGAEDSAVESDDWHNGVFTYAVLKGLNSLAADLDGDNTIKVSELYQYTVDEVQRLTGNKQRPAIKRENFEFDFPLFEARKPEQLYDGGNALGAQSSISIVSKRVAFCTTDQLSVLDMVTGKELLHRPNTNRLSMPMLSAEGDALLAWEQQAPIVLAVSKNQIRTFGATNLNPFSDLRYSPAGKRLVCGAYPKSEDFTVFEMNGTTISKRTFSSPTVSGYSQNLIGAQFGSGDEIKALLFEQGWYAFDQQTGVANTPFKVSSQTLRRGAVRFSPSAKFLVTEETGAGSSRRVTAIEASNLKAVREWTADDADIVVLTPDGPVISATWSTNDVPVVVFSTEQSDPVFKTRRRMPDKVSVSPDGKYMAIARNRYVGAGWYRNEPPGYASVTVWNLKNKKRVEWFHVPDSHAGEPIFCDSTHLYWLAASGSLYRWNFE